MRQVVAVRTSFPFQAPSVALYFRVRFKEEAQPMTDLEQAKLEELKKQTALLRKQAADRNLPGAVIFVGLPTTFAVVWLASYFPQTVQDTLGGWIIVIAFVVGFAVAGAVADATAKS